MCIKCKKALIRLFPKADNDLLDYILWEKTAFPFGDSKTIIRQLKEAKKELASKGVL